MHSRLPVQIGFSVSPWNAISEHLFVEGNVQFFGEGVRVEGAAGEIAVTHFERGYFAFAVVGAEDDAFGGFVFFYIYLIESDGALQKEIFDAAAIGAPAGAVDSDEFHGMGGLDYGIKRMS